MSPDGMQRAIDADAKLARDLDQIDDWFTYHAPTEAQRTLLEDARNSFRLLARWLVQNVADSRERAIALTEMRKTAMLVNQAIVFNR